CGDNKQTRTPFLLVGSPVNKTRGVAGCEVGEAAMAADGMRSVVFRLYDGLCDDVDGDEVMKMVRVACRGDGGDESQGGVVRRLWWRRRWGRGDEVVAGGLGVGVAGVWPESGRKNRRRRKMREEKKEEREGVGDEEVVVGEGMVVRSSSLEMLINSCLGGIMVSLIFLKGLEEEALVEFMVEMYEEDEDSRKNEKDGLFNLKANDQSRKERELRNQIPKVV
ncbi:hypothetical protein Tco_0660556, partial [Tanacetum coccineum]